MSNLFRKNPNGLPLRPRPSPISISELEGTSFDHPRSDSSSSSTDSAASVTTVRPNSREQQAESTYWTNYFARELFLDKEDGARRARYHVYLTPPSKPDKGPLIICHHGAGSSGLSFALFAQHVRNRLPDAGILSLEARAHGSVVTRPMTTSKANDEEEPTDFSIEALATDAQEMIEMTRAHMGWPTLPPCVLIGHSLGGAVVTHLAASSALGDALVGFCVIDVVEGSALEALSHMKSYLASRPTSFASLDDAIHWHTRTRTIRDAASARVSVPALLTRSSSAAIDDEVERPYSWKTDLAATSPWWEGWFAGLSARFLRGRGGKLLILAGTDRLDRELTIAQMQGRFQLAVIPEAGHFVHEDAPARTADLVVEFWRRNDRGSLVLPPKVADLIAQGKKV